MKDLINTLDEAINKLNKLKNNKIMETTISVQRQNGNESDITVFYDYQPAEAQTYEHEGCYADVSIWKIEFNGREVTDLDWDFSELEEKVMEDHNDNHFDYDY